MRRRAFLAGLAAAPWWIRRAFGDASVGGAPSLRPAQPTLVLVVPRDENARWQRGAALGDWLNHASDRDIAVLALVDVLCAPAAAYGRSDEPIFLGLGLPPEPGRVRAVSGPVPADPLQRAVRLGAMARQATDHSMHLDPRSVAELARTARQRYVRKAPRGARWGRTTMCGNEYEEGPAEQVDCGMGHVPEASRRFLDFYVGKRS